MKIGLNMYSLHEFTKNEEGYLDTLQKVKEILVPYLEENSPNPKKLLNRMIDTFGTPNEVISIDKDNTKEELKSIEIGLFIYNINSYKEKLS